MTPLIKRLELDREYYFAEGCYINELSNAEHDPAVSIARARVPVGVTTRWHALTGVVERYLIEAGQGDVVRPSSCMRPRRLALLVSCLLRLLCGHLAKVLLCCFQ